MILANRRDFDLKMDIPDIVLHALYRPKLRPLGILEALFTIAANVICLT